MAFPKLATIRRYMDTEVHTLRADDLVMDGVRKLLAKHVTGAPVVDDDNRVIGMLTEKDCLKLLAVGDVNAERATGKVSEYMTLKVVTVKPEMNIYFVAGMFLNDNVRRYPVVNDDGILIGAITRYDIVRAIEAGLPEIEVTPVPVPRR
ncbi:MAG: CBS domain-containing protein [Alphaproteobacteria bacterium]|nr:CBS domain-containing protein [Alphaproteobacteria bacterium]